MEAVRKRSGIAPARNGVGTGREGLRNHSGIQTGLNFFRATRHGTQPAEQPTEPQDEGMFYLVSAGSSRARTRPVSRIPVSALPDPSSAENNIPRIKHRGLSRGNRALRHIELHPGGSGIDRLDGGRRGLVAVTDLHRRAYRRFENGERNPIDVSYFAGLRTQLHIIADDNAVDARSSSTT